MRTSPANRTSATLLLLILLVAALLRFWALDSVPPGLTTDEAANGADVLDILQGKAAVFMERNEGREALFIYVQAASVAILGPTSLALRLPAALFSLLTVAAVFFLTRRLAGGPAALLAAAAMAVGYWPVQDGREGFRAASLPFFETVAFVFLWRGLDRARLADFLAAGIFLGLSLYIYPAARILPAVLFAVAVLLPFTKRPSLAIAWRGMFVTLAAMAVVAVPLAAYFMARPASLSARLTNVSATGTLDPRALLVTLGENVLPTLGMFFVRGDAQWKYNLSNQPVFGPLWAALFVGGLVVALWRVRRLEYSFLLIWLAISLLPGALSGESPHFLRTIGAMPAVYILPALALVAIGQHLRSRVPVHALVAAGVIFLAGTGALTAWRYFGIWANAPQVSYYFYADMNAASQFLNAWQGPEQVMISAEYYDQHHTMMSYLLSPRPREMTWMDARRAMVFPAPRPEGVLYILPASAAPPAGATVRLLPGAKLVAEAIASSGAPLMKALAVTAPAMPAPSHPLSAILGGKVQIIGYDLEPDTLTPGGSLSLRIYWRVLQTSSLPASQSYTFFSHLVDDGGYRWAQDDGIGFFTPEWELGDSVITTAILQVPPDAPPRTYHLRFGLYSPAEQLPLSVLDQRGAPAGTELETIALPLDRTGAVGVSAPPPKPLRSVQWDNLRLDGFALSRDALGPGETLRATLYWTAAARLPVDRELILDLVDATGTTRASWRGHLVAGYPAAIWQSGETIRNWYDLPVPADTPAGEYHVRASLDPAAGPSADLGMIRIAGRPRSFSPPTVQHPAPARISDFAELLGYAVQGDPVRAGQRLNLTLYWRALATAPASYKVFVHLLDSQSVLWGQRDAEPQDGGAPTTSWIAGEIITDTYSIPLQAGSPPGEYDIEIGMYSLPSGARLPMTNAIGQPAGDHLILGRVSVVQ